MDRTTSFNEENALFNERVVALHLVLTEHDPDASLQFAEDLLTMEDYYNTSKPAGVTSRMSLTELFGPSKSERELRRLERGWFALERDNTGNTVNGLTFGQRMKAWGGKIDEPVIQIVDTWESSIAALLPSGTTLTVQHEDGRYSYRFVVAHDTKTQEDYFIITPGPPGLTAAQERVVVTAALARMKEERTPV